MPYSPPPPSVPPPPVPLPGLLTLLTVGTPVEQDTIMVTELAAELKATCAILAGPRATRPIS